MKAVVVILVLVVILAVVGWLKFSNDGGNPTIQVDTQEMRDDTQHVVDEARDLVGDNEPQPSVD